MKKGLGTLKRNSRCKEIEFLLSSRRRFGLHLPKLWCLWTLIVPFVAAALAGTQAFAQTTNAAYTFTTYAGTLGQGSDDGTGAAARFAWPMHLAADVQGNLYVADHMNYTVRKVTPDGVVTTVAGLAGCPGTNNGAGSAARFRGAFGVAIDTSGALYLGLIHEHTIRKLTPIGADWVVTLMAGIPEKPGSADGTGATASFQNPAGVAVNSAGDVYVADRGNHTIRKVTPAGVVTTVAGLAGTPGSANGTGSAARFSGPVGIAVDASGNLYVADRGNSTIRKITPNKVVTTLAGSAGNAGNVDGFGTSAQFDSPFGLAVDTNGTLYVADFGSSTIRKVTSAGWVTTIAGFAYNVGTNNGIGSAARFYRPYSVAIDTAGNLHVSDGYNNTIRKMTPLGANWVVTTLAGRAAGRPGTADGTGSGARFNFPNDLAIDGNGNLYVADEFNHTIRKVAPGGVVTTLAGSPGNAGSADGMGSAARFYNPEGVTVDGSGNIYVADGWNFTIRKVTPAGFVTTFAGFAGAWGSDDGTGSSARFSEVTGLASDPARNIYVADFSNHTIRKITPQRVVTTIAGLAGNPGSDDGTGSTARFNGPARLALDRAGNIYVSDNRNYTLRKMTPSGSGWLVTTIAGSPGQWGSDDGMGSAARFSIVNGIAADTDGHIYVVDSSNCLLRKVTPAGSNWMVTTIAGDVTCGGGRDGTGKAASFAVPTGLALGNDGIIYISDYYGHTIRKGFPASSVPPPALLSPNLTAGQFKFGITGLSSIWVNLESSADLSTWGVVGTRLLEGGTNYFSTSSQPDDSLFLRAYVR